MSLTLLERSEWLLRPCIRVVKCHLVRVYRFGLGVGDESVAGLDTFRSLSEHFADARRAIEAREWDRARDLIDKCLQIEAKEGAFDVSRLLLGQMELIEKGAKG